MKESRRGEVAQGLEAVRHSPPPQCSTSSNVEPVEPVLGNASMMPLCSLTARATPVGLAGWAFRQSNILLLHYFLLFLWDATAVQIWLPECVAFQCLPCHPWSSIGFWMYGRCQISYEVQFLFTCSADAAVVTLNQSHGALRSHIGALVAQEQFTEWL